MKLLLTALSLFLLSSYAGAQSKISIHGIVRNEHGRPLSGASVSLFYDGSKDSLRTVTNDKGIFDFSGLKAVKTGVAVTYVGYDAFARYYDYDNVTGQQTITDINMVPGGQTLTTVVVEASKVQIREDTVSYKIDSSMYHKNDNVEEVLKKLPGVEVDKSGNVTAQGQQVTKVKVNGKDFFGGDVTTATRQLTADMVDKVDIIDDYGDQAAFTGVKTGDPTKTLNIQLKKDKNKGYFGNASLGGGTDGRYTNSLNINKFNNSQQISLIGNLNNANASTFNFGSSGNSMIRSLGGNVGGSGNGIATTKSIGLNYRDQWGSKISVYGSYSFTNRATTTLKDVTQQNLLPDGSTNIYTPKTSDYTVSDNHRFTFNLEYKIDSFNYLKFSPSVNYGSTSSNYLSDFATAKNGQNLSTGNTTDISNSKTPNISGSLLFNHRFDRKGRILSINLNAGTNSTDGNDTYNNLTTYYDSLGVATDSLLNQYITQDNKNHNYSVSATYIEPLNKRQSIEFNYSYNKRFTGIDKETFNIDPLTAAKDFEDTLSNIYNNEYTTNRFGINLRNNQKKFNYTIGLAVQPATINSDSKTTKIKYSQSLVNFYPVVRFAYNFSRSRSFNINYNGSTSQPSYQQLQPVYDYSNPQYITVGNPDLKPEFSNNLSMRYNNFDFISGNVFFGNLNFNYIKDKIVNVVAVQKDGVQVTSYQNSNGYYTASGFYAFSKPIQNRKFVFNYGGNLMYNNNVSFLKDTLGLISKNLGRNWVLTQRFNTMINIKKWLETSAGVSYTLNDNKYSLNARNNSTVRTWSLTHSTRIFLPKDFTISYDIDKAINSGFGIDANPFLINGSLEKIVSKKYNASLKLNFYDLLNENTSITRTVTGNSVIDTRTNKLGRYAMLSFIFRFNKFTGEAPRGAGGPGMRMGGPGM